MKKKLLIFSCLLFFISILAGNAQNLILNSSVTGVCYAGKSINKIYIPPPDNFFSKSGKGTGASVVFYYYGFPAKARLAAEKAGRILESILPSDAHITVVANWQNISEEGVLGNSSITGYVGGWNIDALNPFVLYPVALAEKIAGEKFNDDNEGDFILTLNSSINWYLGTDGNTPTTQYDLITVILHEILHGLGFFDSMATNGNIGFYGFSSFPMIYDTFLENSNGKKITDSLQFDNYSYNLYSQLTGNNLFFNGPVLNKLLSGGKSKIWAPTRFDPGSSISHLDENEYPPGSVNSIMTPYINYGEAIHNPGDLTTSILGDLGWINTRFKHIPPKDTEQPISSIDISAKIESDTAFNRNKVAVVYSFDNFLSDDTVYMSSPDGDNLFNATVTIPSYEIELQYYLYTEDYFLRQYRSPSLINELRFRVFIGTDTVKPVIKHDPYKYFLESVESVDFRVQAVDNLAVDSVYVEYKINTGPSKYLGLKADSTDIYKNILNAKQLGLEGDDSIQYRIFAIDSALIPNISVLPKTGYFVIDIENLESPLIRYSTDFSDAADVFFNIGFEVIRPEGFGKYGLHTRHPYESPEDNNKSIDYISLLRYPLLFDESGLLITFNELVLVEPGEPGSLPGSPEFYDYVILEGSKDFGKNWFPITDGYDSRYFEAWESAYNGSIVEGNSVFIGSETMLQKHTLFLRQSDNISDGDTLLLRFRLYSDPFANGWGWVIEDLNIGALVDPVEDIVYEPFKIFPNPGSGFIKIKSGNVENKFGGPVKFNLFNSAGILIKEGYISSDSESTLDISGYPSGLYIILIYYDDVIKRIKYTLIK